MHELALARNVLEIILEKTQDQPCERVTLVRLDIGALGHVEPDALRFCFAAVVKGSIADGAILKISRTPGRAQCQDCKSEVQITALGSPCPECGSHHLHITKGREMRVRDIEIQ